MGGHNDFHRESTGLAREVERVSRGGGSPGFSPAALRNALDRASLTVEDFADSVGVTRQAVSAWLSGATTPAPASLVRAATVLNIAPADLTPHTAAAAAHIADLRVQSGLTQGQLARELGIAQSALSDIERGRRQVDDELVVRIARILHISDVDAVVSAWERALAERGRSLQQRTSARRRGK